jgi:hypothetical protein
VVLLFTGIVFVDLVVVMLMIYLLKIDAGGRGRSAR